MVFGKIVDWGYREGMKGIREKIQKIIKKKRLVFLSDDKVAYTEKNNKTTEYTFDEFVKVAIDVGGWQQNMTTLGITEQDIKNVLTEEYVKLGRAK